MRRHPQQHRSTNRATKAALAFSAALVMAFVLSPVVGLGQDSAPGEVQAAIGFDDPVEPLAPRIAPGEIEADRTEAELLFTQGRLLALRGDREAALRNYERAYRCDPQPDAVLREIVPLAFRLGRNEEGARYAIISAERNPQDADLLVRLAMYLAQDQQWDRALRLYHHAIQLQADEELSESLALLRFETGRLYVLTGDPQRAADEFEFVRKGLVESDDEGLQQKLKEALQKKGEPGDAYALMAEAFLAAERADRAEEFFRLANDAAADEFPLQTRLSRVAALRGEHQAALEMLEKALLDHPEKVDKKSCEQLAELLSRVESDPEKAQAELATRLEKLYDAGERKNVDVALRLAAALEAAERVDEARAVYEPLLADKPAFEVHGAWIDFQRKHGSAESLLDALGAAVEQTGSPAAIGAQIRQIAEDGALVDQLLVAAGVRRDGDPPAISSSQALAIAHVALAAKRADVAQVWFENSHAVGSEEETPKSPTIDELAAWGLELLVAEEAKRAAQVLRQAIELGPTRDKEAELQFQLAGALTLIDETDEAVAAARRAAEFEPRNPLFPSREAWALYRADRFGEAKSAYEGLIEKFDDQHNSSRVRQILRSSRLALSGICLKLDETDAAIEWLQQVLDEFPDDVSALNDLGYLWADRGEHLQRAARMASKAVAAEPDNAAYRDSLGWAFYRLGRYAEAVQELEAAVAVEKADGVILDHLGDAYLMANERDKALAAWKDAAAIFEREGEADMLEATRQKIAERSTPAPQKPPPD